MSANQLPHAVILGLADTGYGIVRSLSALKVPIIAFESDPDCPEVQTRLCEVRLYSGEDALLGKLIELCNSLESPPVLYISADSMVKFYDDHRHLLENRLRIDFPASETVRLLLEKSSFSRYAVENGFKIPLTRIIRTREDFDAALDDLRFPCLVKPYWRDRNWKAAKFPKVFYFKDRNLLLQRFSSIFQVENNLIIQEWVPGTDRNIFFCLTYFGKSAQHRAHFTGRKLRQWPVGTGSTSCAEPADAAEVEAETLRLFHELSYAGFGSVEFKVHPETGEYYIMEPTIGRPNHQSYLATANGINLPALAYESLTGVQIRQSTARGIRRIWIDDQFDALSILVSFFRGKLNFRDLIRSYLSRKSFRFLNKEDPRPFIFVFLRAPAKVLIRVKRILSRLASGLPWRARSRVSLL